jgi:plastocyanin
VCGAKEPVLKGWLDLTGRKVAGVLIYLDAQKQKGAEKQRVSIDQKNCTFVPRVAAMGAGSSVRFTNSDPLLHNVHLYDPSGRSVANYAMPAKGQVTNSIVLKKPGRYRVGCDAGHGWMNGHIAVFDHPFFTLSQKGGKFDLGRVPVGRHRLVAWHPDLGEREATIVVPAKGRIEVRVEY